MTMYTWTLSRARALWTYVTPPHRDATASDVESTIVTQARVELRMVRMRLAVATCFIGSVLFALSWLAVHRWVYGASRPFESIQIRASRNVQHDGDIPGPLRSFLWTQMTDNPDMCGISAPHVQHYYRFFLMRVDGRVMEVFNPQYITDYETDTSTVTVRELDRMCHWNESAVLRQRNETIALLYQRGVHQSALRDVFSGTVALCVQHLMDILEGVWPCSPDSKLPLDVSRVPRVPSQWSYTAHS